MAMSEKQIHRESDALSIIENVNITQVSNTMQKINQFQTIVQKTLRQDHDYGVIPGTSKPTLLKPGAEKILMLMGVSSEYELIERVQDYEHGFFAYTFKCILSRNNQIITEGVGHCNTKEKKYINQDPYTLANTCLKMAKKRAQIDAVLTISSLSEVFTQDLEDMEEISAKKPQKSKSNGRNKASQKQLNFIYGKANELKISGESMKRIMAERYHIESSSQLTKENASDLIELLFKVEKGEEPHPDERPFSEEEEEMQKEVQYKMPEENENIYEGTPLE